MLNARFIQDLRRIAGDEAVLHREEDLMLYEYDGGLSTGSPEVVVLPRTTAQVAEIVRQACAAGVCIVPRGAGTGLSGGAIPRKGGVVIGFSRMNRILEVDVPNLRAVVQPGVVNLEISQEVARYGLYFAPDPSSQKACTIGGNVAENAGGPHTLAYGVTVNHVTGLEVVLPDGRIVQLGGKALDLCGYDLTGFFVGSEGTLGITTAVTIKLMRLPEAVVTLLGIFDTVEAAANTVTAITAGGITPSALEMLDGLTMRAVEGYAHAGYPLDAAAGLLIELEGLHEAVAEQVQEVSAVCQRLGVRELRRAGNEAERQSLWKGRKNAFGALGRLAPAYYTQDGVVPRTKIAEVLHFVDSVSKKYELLIGNVFHAGDGNLHPCILFDPRDPAQVHRTHEAGREILEYCIQAGGTITGEHGIGMEKNELMASLFTADDLDIMQRLHDAFNPLSMLNPQKVFPTSRSCRETAQSRPPALAGDL